MKNMIIYMNISQNANCIYLYADDKFTIVVSVLQFKICKKIKQTSDDALINILLFFPMIRVCKKVKQMVKCVYTDDKLDVNTVVIPYVQSMQENQTNGQMCLY